MSENKIKVVVEVEGKDAEQAVAKLGKSFRNLTDESDKAGKAMERTGKSASGLSSIVRDLAAAYAAYKVGEFAKDSAVLAAQYETLGVVMQVAGRNAGYSQGQMNDLARSLQASGITMRESRQSVVSMATAHLDLAQATQLSRAAQDLAVVGMTNSSDAYARLIYAIQSAQPEMVRTLGINVNFEQAYQKAAAAQDRSTASLSENEKAQIRMNAVLEKAARYQGIYEAGMTTAGKKMTSLARYYEDFKVKLGESFGPATIVLVDELTATFKRLQDAAESQEMQDKLENIANAFAKIGTGIMENAVPALDKFASTFSMIADVWNSIPSDLRTILVAAAIGGKVAGPQGAGAAAVVGLYAKADDIGKSFADWFASVVDRRFVVPEPPKLQGPSKQEMDAAKRLYREDLRRIPMIGDQRDYGLRALPDDQPILTEEMKRRIQEAKNALIDVQNALRVTFAEDQGDKVGAELAKLKAELEKYKGDKAKELIGAPAQAQADIEAAVASETKLIGMKSDFIIKSAALDRQLYDAEAQARLDSLGDIDDYYSKIQAIRAKYAKDRLKPKSDEARWADALEAGEIGGASRERSLASQTSLLALQAQAAQAQADRASTISGFDRNSAMAAQAALVEIEGKQRLLEINHQLAQAQATYDKNVALAASNNDPLLRDEIARNWEQVEALQAAKDAVEQLTQAKKQDAEKARDWQTGMQDGLQSYLDMTRDMAGQTKGIVSDAFQGMDDSLSRFLVNGEANWSSFINMILLDLTKMQVRNSITGPLSGWVGDFFGFSGRASGGSVMPGGTYLVGENGPEVLHMGNSSGRVSNQLGGMSVQISISIPASSGDKAQDQTYADMAGAAAAKAMNAWWNERYTQAQRPGGIANGGLTV